MSAKADAALARHGLTRRQIDRYLERARLSLPRWAQSRGYMPQDVRAALAGTPSALAEQILSSMADDLANELMVVRREIRDLQDSWVGLKTRLEELERYLGNIE